MSNSIAWLFLVLSGVADVVRAITTKYAAEYTKFGWTAVSVVALKA